MIANLLKKMMSRCGHKTFVHTIKIIYTYYLAMRVLYCFYFYNFYRFGGVGLIGWSSLPRIIMRELQTLQLIS